MSRAWMSLVPVLALAAVGCNSEMKDENALLRRQNIELQEQLRARDTELAGRPQASDLAALQGEIAQRDRMIADLQNQLSKPQPGEAPDPALAGITVTRDDARGTITVNVPGDVLFASGDASLKASAKKTLDKIADILNKDFAGKPVLVNGHTDADPIVKTKDKWKDNLDLSAARARTVSEYLVSQGVNQSRVGARAFGPTDPKSSKDQSRRVEIVVVTK